MPDFAYIAQGEHCRDPALPLAGFAGGVANAGIPAGQLEAATDPGSIWLSSHNAQFLTLAGPMSPFYKSLRAKMTPYLLADAMRDPIPVNGQNGIFFDYRKADGAIEYALWIASNHVPGRGIYLDELTEVVPLNRRNDVRPPHDDAFKFWPEWRDRFVAYLRVAVGPSVVIVANTAGWRSSVLNGICQESKTAPAVLALARYAMQWTSGTRPVVQIDWSGRWSLPAIGLHRGVFLPGVRLPDA